MIKDKIIDMYHKMDMYDKEFMIGLLAKDMFVPVEIDYQDGGKTVSHCMDISAEKPVCFNGASLQLNLEDSIKVRSSELYDDNFRELQDKLIKKNK
tara:strand:+ start:266 stop:553 length:288 start_codon:yes stop_codon:yes gene_type:complete